MRLNRSISSGQGVQTARSQCPILHGVFKELNDAIKYGFISYRESGHFMLSGPVEQFSGCADSLIEGILCVNVEMDTIFFHTCSSWFIYEQSLATL